jgi:predicted PurR-regulated permease PerM
MNILDRSTASVLSTILLFAVAGAFLYGARKILIVFVFAILFAYLVYPLVLIVQRKSRLSPHSRDGAILQVYLILFICLAGIVLGVGPHIVDEGRRLGAALPSLIDKLTSGQIAWTIGGKHGWSHETQLRIQQFLAAHRDAMVAWAQDIGGKAALVLSDAIWLVLIPILAIFFLRDGQKMAEQTIRMADVRRDRVLVRGIADDIDVMLAGYIRAQLLLAGLSLIVYTGVLLMMRVPYAAILGVLTGIAEFVPVVGPLAAALSFGGTAMGGESIIGDKSLYHSLRKKGECA